MEDLATIVNLDTKEFDDDLQRVNFRLYREDFRPDYENTHTKVLKSFEWSKQKYLSD